MISFIPADKALPKSHSFNKVLEPFTYKMIELEILAHSNNKRPLVYKSLFGFIKTWNIAKIIKILGKRTYQYIIWFNITMEDTATP